MRLIENLTIFFICFPGKEENINLINRKDLSEERENFSFVNLIEGQKLNQHPQEKTRSGLKENKKPAKGQKKKYSISLVIKIIFCISLVYFFWVSQDLKRCLLMSQKENEETKSKITLLEQENSTLKRENINFFIRIEKQEKENNLLKEEKKDQENQELQQKNNALLSEKEKQKKENDYQKKKYEMLEKTNKNLEEKIEQIKKEQKEQEEKFKQTIKDLKSKIQNLESTIKKIEQEKTELLEEKEKLGIDSELEISGLEIEQEKTELLEEKEKLGIDSKLEISGLEKTEKEIIISELTEKQRENNKEIEMLKADLEVFKLKAAQLEKALIAKVEDLENKKQTIVEKDKQIAEMETFKLQIQQQKIEQDKIKQIELKKKEHETNLAKEIQNNENRNIEIITQIIKENSMWSMEINSNMKYFVKNEQKNIIIIKGQTVSFLILERNKGFSNHRWIEEIQEEAYPCALTSTIFELLKHNKTFEEIGEIIKNQNTIPYNAWDFFENFSLSEEDFLDCFTEIEFQTSGRGTHYPESFSFKRKMKTTQEPVNDPFLEILNTILVFAVEAIITLHRLCVGKHTNRRNINSFFIKDGFLQKTMQKKPGEEWINDRSTLLKQKEVQLLFNKFTEDFFFCYEDKVYFILNRQAYILTYKEFRHFNFNFGDCVLFSTLQKLYEKDVNLFTLLQENTFSQKLYPDSSQISTNILGYNFQHYINNEHLSFHKAFEKVQEEYFEFFKGTKPKTNFFQKLIVDPFTITSEEKVKLIERLTEKNKLLK